MWSHLSLGPDESIKPYKNLLLGGRSHITLEEWEKQHIQEAVRGYSRYMQSVTGAISVQSVTGAISV